ncbi:hypothetical protein TURU_132846 [Turdus rufiventris]|nr:hypothetical protein TURU_132846 [Turdus rufiventris]
MRYNRKRVDKEQIQLVISPDTVYQKKNWCSSDIAGMRDQNLTWGGPGLAVPVILQRSSRKWDLALLVEAQPGQIAWEPCPVQDDGTGKITEPQNIGMVWVGRDL